MDNTLPAFPILPRSVALDVPTHALCILNNLEQAGFEAWIVGGWVRDTLRAVRVGHRANKPKAHDVDITCSATWQQAARVLRAAGITVHETGTAHGTITAVVDNQPIEVTTFRTEGSYSDRRHPDNVRYVQNVQEDLARRDFTINAMAYHPERGLLDLFGGERDLALGNIRTVGNPQKRFEEDALRILRAVRFACRLGYTIDSSTACALNDCANELAFVAQERIGQELAGIMESGRMAWALKHHTQVMLAAIPELKALFGFNQLSPWHAFDAYEHTTRVCRAIEEFSAGLASPQLRWAALLHDIAKPACFTTDDTGRGHFYGHPQLGAHMAHTIMRRLALPAELERAACTLIKLHDYPLRTTPDSVRHVLHDLEQSSTGQGIVLAFELLTLKRADAVSKARHCAAYAIELDQIEKLLRAELEAGAILSVRDLALDGNDIMQITGHTSGPSIGKILDELLSQVLDGTLRNTREDLLSFVRKSNHPKGT